MKKIGVVLAGCGVFDGSEIHEAVLTLLHFDEVGAEVQCFAPDKEQMHVVNHLTGQPAARESRNVLIESARIARGKIKPLNELKIDDFDAVVFPGGFGAAKNLCTFAVDGTDCKIDSQVAAVIKAAHAAGKVIGALCISPVVIAGALKDAKIVPELTIGTDPGTSKALSELGATPIKAQTTDVVVDRKNKIVTTPCYMLATKISQVSRGIENFVKEVMKLA
jgi:enhancing lycopene biosynthesis protein 2